MKLEEEESGSGEESNGAKVTENRLGGQAVKSLSSAPKSLKYKVRDILTAVQGNSKNAATAIYQASLNPFSALDVPLPLSTCR